MMINILTAFFRPVRSTQSYVNLLYLVVAFLLGSGYLVFLATGIALSLATLPIMIGILLSLFMIFAMQKLAVLERYMARTWLKVSIPPPYATQSARIGFLRHFIAAMKSPVTWKNLIYFLAKAIFGTLSSEITLSLILLSLILFFGSLAYAIDMAVNFLFHIQPFPEAALTHLRFSITIQVTPFAGLDRLPLPLLLLRLVFNALLGLLLFVGDLHLGNSLAAFWGLFAARVLGASQYDLQLAEARGLAAQEQARAEQADQKRRELITNMSHELRTPVASIQGHIESLLKACDSDATTPLPLNLLRTYLTIVHRESLRLGALVDDLLALSRAETDELRLKLEAVTAEEVVEEVYQTVMPLARRERQIAMVQQVEPALPSVLADRQRLTQILLNLVRNAITYTPDGGIISISLHRADEEHLALLVSDTGIGIPPQDLDRIFERFYRIDASRTRRSGGAGLGLAIVRDFVVAMGGSISVESVVGEGSTFRVLLQIAQISTLQERANF